MLHLDQRAKAKEQKVSGEDSDERTGDGLLAVLAKHSTDVSTSCTDAKVMN